MATPVGFFKDGYQPNAADTIFPVEGWWVAGWVPRGLAGAAFPAVAGWFRDGWLPHAVHAGDSSVSHPFPARMINYGNDIWMITFPWIDPSVDTPWAGQLYPTQETLAQVIP